MKFLPFQSWNGMEMNTNEKEMEMEMTKIFMAFMKKEYIMNHDNLMDET
jgi:hypothetical protein